MEDKQTTISLRLDKETKDYLDLLVNTSGLAQSEVIRYLIGLGAQYGLLKTDWKERLIVDEVRIFAEKERVRISGEMTLFDLREASKDKDRQTQLGLKLLDAYLKTMTNEQRKQYIEDRIRQNRAVSGEDYNALPVLTDNKQYEVRLNGKLLIVKELVNGYPKLEFNQERLVKCEGGFHTKGTWCYGCSLIATCSLVREERLGVKT